jgi:predicted XRE-type DNA-binding protein
MSGKKQDSDYYVAERLIRKARQYRDAGSTACLERNRGLNQDGYTRISFGSDKRKRFAHRVIYERLVGSIPPGHCVLHSCDNRRCVNPLHLFTGTHQNNMDDMNSKGRGNYASGEQIPNSKLTAQQVSEIRRLTNDGYKQQELADQFGVNQTTISNLLRKRTWREVP